MPIETIVPLHDLGRRNPAWSGILSPEYDDETVNKYIQKQFLEDAATYAQRYQDTAHWKGLLQEAQRHFQLDSDQPLILDIGSGAGNSVFPLLELYPHANVVASDLSVPLLKILKDYLQQHYPARSCLVIQLNAENLPFQDEQFDLISGGSILHHLFAPEAALKECARILKAGGSAVFFEPFEIGNQILAIVLKDLIRLSEWDRRLKALEPEIVRFLEAVCFDYKSRLGTDKSSPQYLQMDDKWLFTKDYIERMRRQGGFSNVIIQPINVFNSLFSTRVEVLLHLGLGTPPSALPTWAWEYLREMDDHFSDGLRPELFYEAAIILRK
jgi:ubiquinone/menaquinone biosynthesis C-methylase UbiE